MGVVRWWLMGAVGVGGLLALAGCDEIAKIGNNNNEEILSNPSEPETQAYEGDIVVYGLTSFLPTQALAGLPSPDNDDVLGAPARMLARPPIPDDDDGGPFELGDEVAFGVETSPEVFLERWMFGNERQYMALTDSGFAMVWLDDRGTTCDQLMDVANDMEWATPQVADQELTYTTPPPAPAPALAGASFGRSYTVYQPVGNFVVERGRMYRLTAGDTFQDHWLLTESYLPLGKGGLITLVIPDDPSFGTLQDWYPLGAAEVGGGGNYTHVTYSFSGLGTCTDRR